MKMPKSHMECRLLEGMICNVIKRINIVQGPAVVYNREKLRTEENEHEKVH